MLKKVSVLILTMILMCLVCSVPAFGYTVHISEDFEDFVADRWRYKSSLFGQTAGNTYMILNNTDSANRMIMQEGTSTPAPEFFLSADFMIPEDGSTLVQVLGATYCAGKGEGCHVWYDNGDLKLGYSSSVPENAVVVATGLETGRWYNVFAHIDHSVSSETPKFTVYFGESKTEEQTFVTKISGPASQGCGFVGRWFIARENTGKDAYLDNILVVPVENFDFEVELFKAKSIATNMKVGYEDGQYPESAVSMFIDTYKEIYALAESGAITGDNFEEYKTQLTEAVEILKNSKIDLSDESTEPVYIRINESGNMVNSCATYPGEDFVMPLEAGVYTKAGTKTDAEIIWSIESGSDDVKIQDGSLIVKAGYEGDFTLKAEYDNLYATYQISVISIRDINVTLAEGNDGKITVEGNVSDSVMSDVKISVTSSEEGGISIENVLEIKDDNSFTWTKDVSEETPSQYFTVKISSTETIEKTVECYYYTDGWEEQVLGEINNADKEELAKVLGVHSKKLFVEKTVLDSYEDAYCTRIAEKKPYADINAVSDAAEEIEFVILHANATRNDIESIVLGKITLLKKNGFDVSKLNELTAEEKRSFYINIATIDVDALVSTAKDIADEYNRIFDAFGKEESSGSGNSGGSISSGSSGGIGGGGGSGSSGGKNKYTVSLVGGTGDADSKEETEKEEKQEEKVESFADVKTSDWYYDALTFMRQKGIMEGDGTNVRPLDTITRGEFAKIVVTAFDIKTTEDSVKFSDSIGPWWGEYAEIAASAGIVNGMGDGTFGGNSSITREMLAVMIDRAITAKNIELYDQNESTDFADEEYFSEYSAEAIERLGQKGIVSGIGNGIFAPKTTVTRAEAAQIVYNVLKNL